LTVTVTGALLVARTYIAIIGDAVASRELPARERRRLQGQLRSVLAAANRRWRRALAARFAVTLGDQFEGLLAGPERLWEVVHWLRAELTEGEWLVACGRGGIRTALARTAPEVDGPCFHLARAALEEAKHKRLVLAFGGFDPVVTALGHYYSALYWSWTSRQREVATQLRAVPRGRLAERLRVTPSAVSHVASRMAWRLVRAGDAVFGDRLARS
jgi:hypothetical protein